MQTETYTWTISLGTWMSAMTPFERFAFFAACVMVMILAPYVARALFNRKAKPAGGLEVKVKRLQPDAMLPTYATDGSACFDIYAYISPAPGTLISPACVTTGAKVTVGTALSFEIPKGYVMLIFSRSGMGFKDNIRLANCTGIIDSDYRGEVRVKLTRDDPCELVVRHGDRIAQAMIVPAQTVHFLEVEQLTDTARGTGGYGSTGK